MRLAACANITQATRARAPQHLRLRAGDCMLPNQRWNRSGFSRLDPTGKFQNLRRLTGWSTGLLTGFLRKVFLH